MNTIIRANVGYVVNIVVADSFEGAPKGALLVAVHGGPLHADDSFSVAVLGLIHDIVWVVRTRDPQLLAEADIRVDVGGEYSHVDRTYDHHQQGAPVRENGVPYAGFGLLWRHYGMDAVAAVTGISDPVITKRVEETLVMPIDASDNGMSLLTGGISRFSYNGREVRGYSMAHAISSLNPSWHEKGHPDRVFQEAVDMAGRILVREIIRAEGVTLAESGVRAAIGEMEGQIIVLEKFCPWQDIVVSECPEALFMVYPSVEGEWMVQAIPPEIGSFEKRRALPEEWAGERGEDLAALIGVKTAIFCHPGRFICGAKTREDALAMAALAVAE